MAHRSAASAGALEFMTIYSTANLPKLLNAAKDEGWRILGAAAEVPEGAARREVGGDSGGRRGTASSDSEGEWDVELGESDVDVGAANGNPIAENASQPPTCMELHTVETDARTVLVLGSEGKDVVGCRDARCDLSVRSLRTNMPCSTNARCFRAMTRAFAT